MLTKLYRLFVLSCILSFQLDAKQPSNASGAFGRVGKISFIENKGQLHDQNGNLRSDIDFSLNRPGMTIFVGNGQIHYQWYQAPPSVASDLREIEADVILPVPPTPVATYRLDVILEGANTSAVIVKENKQEYYENYYLPGSGSKGITHAGAYSKLTYQNIYDNIDWVVYTKDGELKYDFIVHPGGRVSDIRLKYEGASALHIVNGNLEATTPLGKIIEQAPVSFEARSSKLLRSAYTLENNTLSFDVQKCKNTLVIDPAIGWATYYGGSLDEVGECITTDNQNNIYAAGSTLSMNLIATIGAYQDTISGMKDGFFVKLSPGGNRIWATYFGGTSIDGFRDLSFDPLGFINTIGYTASPSGIATAGAYQTINGGNDDIFVSRFDLNGLLQWSTYLGGSGEDVGSGITTDPWGNIYIIGYAHDASITTAGAHQTVSGDGMDACIAKFSSAGQLSWCTLYGGNEPDHGHSVRADSFGNIYVAGTTLSTSNMATPNASFPFLGFLQSAGFLSKFDSSGVQQWGTYTLFAYSMDMGEANDIYLIGMSGYLAPTPGAYQNASAGSMESFLARFDVNGNYIWGTFYGGSSYEVPFSIAVKKDKVYFGGYTSSGSGVSSINGYQPSYGGGFNDGMIVAFDTSGQRLWGSYFGGSGNDAIHDIWVDSHDNLVFTGETYSSNDIATSNGFQTVQSGGDDAFITKFVGDTSIAIQLPFIDTVLCPGMAFNVADTVYGTFQPGNIFSVQLSDSTGDFTNAVTTGSQASVNSGSIPCTIPASTTPASGYRIRIVSTAPVYISMSNDADITILASQSPPSISLSVSPGNVIQVGTNVVFTATAANAGSNPVYRWMKNGIIIPGAASGTYSDNSLVDMDSITVIVYSSNICTMPDSAFSSVIIGINPTGIESSSIAGNIVLYPNPNNGNFTYISKSTTSANLNFEIFSLDGQNVYSEIMSLQSRPTKRFSLKDRLNPGVYYLRVTSERSVETISFTVVR